MILADKLRNESELSRQLIRLKGASMNISNTGPPCVVNNFNLLKNDITGASAT